MLYENYRQSRFVLKTKHLFDKISLGPSKKKEVKKKDKDNLSKDQNEFTRKIEIARSRGYSVSSLLQYEMTDTSYFLTKDGYLTKPDKSDLLGLLRTRNILVNDYQFTPSRRVTVFDFMAEARRIGSRRKSGGIVTFGDAVRDIWKTCWEVAQFSERIDFVFDRV